ncbi:hypothetical protein [Amycolatopsis thermoflava]|uniref:hypothetical protein n=1 Tax=Amycolatopsis thermoflava TaxID=84480 RepID=UPI003EB889FD
MSIRIETEQLVKLLGDLVHTAGGIGATSGVLLHTARGPLEDEPGTTDLLVGTSTDHFTVGHTYVEAYGQLPDAMLWPLADVRAVLAAFRPKAALTRNKSEKHTVVIGREADVLVVREDPDLFNDGLTIRFSEGQISKYPTGLWRALASVPPIAADWGPAEPRSDFYPDVLKPFLTVAKARKEDLQVYRYHHRARYLVQIGNRYVGAAQPHNLWTTQNPGGGGAPEVDVYAPALAD